MSDFIEKKEEVNEVAMDLVKAKLGDKVYS